jgi:ureidoglycolate amidohydrolase
MKLEIDKQRLMAEIEALAAISDAAPPAVTRIVFSSADQKARVWFLARCEEEGLIIRQDAVGNVFLRWMGFDPDAAAVATGSHIDAIPNAGKYDGTVGVLGGLEAMRALRRSGFRPKRSIELILFTSEEPTRFGIGCLGSRLLSGSLSAAAADEFTDQAGASLKKVRREAGFLGALENVELKGGHYHAFVELHIEQGPLLEKQQIPIGIVTKIAAPSSFRIYLEGEGGHAGAVLMPDRHDALCAASELVLAIESAAKSSGSMDTVATVGICEIFPGAVNSIPSRVQFSLDLRDTDLARRAAVMAEVEKAVSAITAKRGVAIRQELINADAPGDCSPQIVEALAASCKKHELNFLPMISRAYHDALFMSRIAPVAMLFIPCRHGYSHRPDEYASPEDIARGTLVLAETLKTLAS